MSKKNNFTKMLKDNAKKITVVFNDSETTLSSITDESADNVVCTSAEGIIPVTAEEAAKESLEGNKMGISVSYVQTAFSMYESTLKYPTAKQSIILTIPATADYLDSFFDCDLEELAALKSRTNLKLIMDKISEKNKKRAVKFVEDDDITNDIFVVKIPNVVMFYDSIKKHETSKCKYFDIICLFVKTKKSLTKLKKKDKENFKDVSNAIVSSTVDLLLNLGISCAHIPLNPILYLDPHDYASAWIKYLKEKDAINKLVNKLVFCTLDTDTLAQFNGQLRAELSNERTIENI